MELGHWKSYYLPTFQGPSVVVFSEEVSGARFAALPSTICWICWTGGTQYAMKGLTCHVRRETRSAHAGIERRPPDHEDYNTSSPDPDCRGAHCC